MNSDGTGLRHLAANLQGAPPAWSPDGAEVATAEAQIVPGLSSRYGPPMNTDVVVIDAASGQARRLTGWSDPNVLHPYSDDPSWWPDGSRLFYLGPDQPALGDERGRQLPTSGSRRAWLVH